MILVQYILALYQISREALCLHDNPFEVRTSALKEELIQIEEERRLVRLTATLVHITMLIYTRKLM